MGFSRKMMISAAIAVCKCYTLVLIVGCHAANYERRHKLNANLLPSVVTSTSEASLASFCPKGEAVCFQWAVPETTISSRSGSIYFQLRANSLYQWIGFGSGSRMRGSSMFVIYQDGNNNITLSTRQGTGHNMPQYVSRTDVELLQGSGIINGTMVANIRCSSCSDVSSFSNWIAAWKTGSPLNSSNPSQSIGYHDGQSSFVVDLAHASVNSDANPFLLPNSSINGQTSGATGVSGIVTGGRSRNNERHILALSHGIIMTVVFLSGFPIGSIMMPLIGNWIIHASWQILSFLGMWAGFALGYIIASQHNSVSFSISPWLQSS